MAGKLPRSSSCLVVGQCSDVWLPPGQVQRFFISRAVFVVRSFVGFYRIEVAWKTSGPPFLSS